jgi:hypothetical protein
MFRFLQHGEVNRPSRFTWSAVFWHDFGMSHSDRLFLIPILQREQCRAAADAPKVRARGWPAVFVSRF